jgi:alcohol dehydrogenase class IV
MKPAATDPGNYDFAVPPLVRFGAGRIGEVGEVAALYGRTAWIVSGGHSFSASGAEEVVAESLRGAGIASRRVAIARGEPTVEDVVAALAALPAERDGVVVVAVGGGAVIDLAKAVAVLATNLSADELRGDIDAAVVDRLEGVGRNLPITQWPLPVVAAPTTAGTGAEATRNAVISCPRRRFKKSMRSPMMVPRAAIVDPTLTCSCQRETTVASGLDAITQLIESFICRFAKPLPRAQVLDALPRAVAALPRVLADPLDKGARAAMSHAALVSGMALANSGLGMAHGVAAALGIECGTPHGLACATMLPVALRVNVADAFRDYATLERAIDPSANRSDRGDAEAFVDRIERLCHEAGAPQRLSALGLAVDRVSWLAENSRGASMRGNPRELDSETLREILTAAL